MLAGLAAGGDLSSPPDGQPLIFQHLRIERLGMIWLQQFQQIACIMPLCVSPQHPGWRLIDPSGKLHRSDKPFV